MVGDRQPTPHSNDPLDDQTNWGCVILKKR